MSQQHLAYSGATPDSAPAGAAKMESNFTELYRGRVFFPEDYGAVGDGVTDDGPAFSAAYLAASVVNGLLRCQSGKLYRIGTTIVVQQNVRVEGNGSTLVGPITAYSPIVATGVIPTIPAGTDAASQCAGACFTDSGGVGVVNGLEFHNLHVQYFRYGMVSQSLAWQFPLFDHVFWENCNIGFFAYQGALGPLFTNSYSGGGAAGTTFVGGATAFPVGNPYTGLDNFFVDGLTYDGIPTRDSSARNPSFDSWFTQSIMRPTTGSVTISGTGYYPFVDQLSLAVSGRCIYAPQRNGRAQYAMDLRAASAMQCDFGFACIANPIYSSIKNVTLEFCFQRGAGPAVYVPMTAGASGLEALFDNIDAASATYPQTAGIHAVSAVGSATFPGTISGTTLTVTGAVINGPIAIGMSLAGAPNASNSFSGTISGSTLTVTSLVIGSAIAAGMSLAGPGVTAGTTITGGSGLSWTLSTPSTVASAVLMIGTATSVTVGTTITAGSGTSWTLSTGSTVASAVQMMASPQGTAAPAGNFVARRISGGIIGVDHFGEYNLPNDVPFNASGAGLGPATVDVLFLNSASTTFPTANACVYYRVEKGGVISKLAYHCNLVSGNMCMAIYRNGYNNTKTYPSRSNFTPGARVATTGSVAVAAGYNEVSLGGYVTVRPGDWIAIAVDNTTAQFDAFYSGVIGTSGLLSGRVQMQSASGFPCPATPGTLAATYYSTIAINGVY